MSSKDVYVQLVTKLRKLVDAFTMTPTMMRRPKRGIALELRNALKIKDTWKAAVQAAAVARLWFAEFNVGNHSEQTLAIGRALQALEAEVKFKANQREAIDANFIALMLTNGDDFAAHDMLLDAAFNEAQINDLFTRVAKLKDKYRDYFNKRDGAIYTFDWFDYEAVRDVFNNYSSNEARVVALQPYIAADVSAAKTALKEQTTQLVEAFLRKNNVLLKSKALVAVDAHRTLTGPGPDFNDGPLEGAVEAMDRLRGAGHEIVIWTVGNTAEAKQWLDKHGVAYDFVNESPYQPDTTSPKIRADAYVDDKAVPFNGNWEETVDQLLKSPLLRKSFVHDCMLVKGIDVSSIKVGDTLQILNKPMKVVGFGSWQDMKVKYPDEAQIALELLPPNVSEDKLGRTWAVQYGSETRLLGKAGLQMFARKNKNASDDVSKLVEAVASLSPLAHYADVAAKLGWSKERLWQVGDDARRAGLIAARVWEGGRNVKPRDREWARDDKLSGSTTLYYSVRKNMKSVNEVACTECDGEGCENCGDGVVQTVDDKRSKTLTYENIRGVINSALRKYNLELGSTSDDVDAPMDVSVHRRGDKVIVAARRSMLEGSDESIRLLKFFEELEAKFQGFCTRTNRGTLVIETKPKGKLAVKNIMRKSKDYGENVRRARGKFLTYDEERHCADFVISTDELDRDGETIDPHAIDLTEFATNPVVCLNHDTDEIPVGISEDVETNKLMVWPSEIDGKKVLIARCYFNMEDQRARRVATAVKNRNLRTASVSFLPDEGATSKNEAGGNHYGKSRLLEWSITTVPANGGANQEVGMMLKAFGMAKAGEQAIGYTMLARMIQQGQLRIIQGQLEGGTTVTVENVATGEKERIYIEPVATSDRTRKSKANGREDYDVKQGENGWYIEVDGRPAKPHDLALPPSFNMDFDSRSQAEDILESFFQEQKSMRKIYTKGNKAVLLKSEGDIDPETQEYLEERGLDDVQMEDEAPAEEDFVEEEAPVAETPVAEEEELVAEEPTEKGPPLPATNSLTGKPFTYAEKLRAQNSSQYRARINAALKEGKKALGAATSTVAMQHANDAAAFANKRGLKPSSPELDEENSGVYLIVPGAKRELLQEIKDRFYATEISISDHSIGWSYNQKRMKSMGVDADEVEETWDDLFTDEDRLDELEAIGADEGLNDKPFRQYPSNVRQQLTARAKNWKSVSKANRGEPINWNELKRALKAKFGFNNIKAGGDAGSGDMQGVVTCRVTGQERHVPAAIVADFVQDMGYGTVYGRDVGSKEVELTIRNWIDDVNRTNSKHMKTASALKDVERMLVQAEAAARKAGFKYAANGIKQAVEEVRLTTEPGGGGYSMSYRKKASNDPADLKDAVRQVRQQARDSSQSQVERMIRELAVEYDLDVDVLTNAVKRGKRMKAGDPMDFGAGEYTAPAPKPASSGFQRNDMVSQPKYPGRGRRRGRVQAVSADGQTVQVLWDSDEGTVQCPARSLVKLKTLSKDDSDLVECAVMRAKDLEEAGDEEPINNALDELDVPAEKRKMLFKAVMARKGRMRKSFDDESDEPRGKRGLKRVKAVIEEELGEIEQPKVVDALERALDLVDRGYAKAYPDGEEDFDAADKDGDLPPAVEMRLKRMKRKCKDVAHKSVRKTSNAFVSRVRDLFGEHSVDWQAQGNGVVVLTPGPGASDENGFSRRELSKIEQLADAEGMTDIDLAPNGVIVSFYKGAETRSMKAADDGEEVEMRAKRMAKAADDMPVEEEEKVNKTSSAFVNEVRHLFGSHSVDWKAVGNGVVTLVPGPGASNENGFSQQEMQKIEQLAEKHEYTDYDPAPNGIIVSFYKSFGKKRKSLEARVKRFTKANEDMPVDEEEKVNKTSSAFVNEVRNIFGPRSVDWKAIGNGVVTLVPGPGASNENGFSQQEMQQIEQLADKHEMTDYDPAPNGIIVSFYKGLKRKSDDAEFKADEVAEEVSMRAKELEDVGAEEDDAIDVAMEEQVVPEKMRKAIKSIAKGIRRKRMDIDGPAGSELASALADMRASNVSLSNEAYRQTGQRL